MWTGRDTARTGAAIVAMVALWGVVRLLVPALDYYPPDRLVRDLERSWLVIYGLRKVAMAVYIAVALVVVAALFAVVQPRWPGRGAVKGLAFGTWIGGVWAFGFLTGWAFLGTTLWAELLNSVVDLLLWASAGWLIGLAVGRAVPTSEHQTPKPWLAVLVVALGFVTVHALGARLLAELLDSTTGLLLVPTTLLQVTLLAGLGVGAGGMYAILRAGPPFESTWARVSFFAFGVFGFAWTWFHVFFVIEFAGVLHELLLVGLIGALGVFAGALVYEGLVRRSRDHESGAKTSTAEGYGRYEVPEARR